MINASAWRRYIDRLSKISDTAKAAMLKWIDQHGLEDMAGLIDYAYAIATKYGEASSALSAAMYDATAELEQSILDPAEPAETASYATVRKAVIGTAKTMNPAIVAGAVARLVKRAGADTTLKNAKRDRIEYAWIAVGDTCPYCLALAAEGWHRGGDMDKGHADHIHANCNCEYSVRFSKRGGVAGYDPDEYRRMFEQAEGDTMTEKINSLRREAYHANGTEEIEI